MKRAPKTFLAHLTVLLCLSGAHSLAGGDNIALMLTGGPRADEVTLSWVGGQPPFSVYGSTNPGAVTEAGNFLGQTSSYSWVDRPLSQGVTYYHVMGVPSGAPEHVFSSSYGNQGASVRPNDISVDLDDNILLSGAYDGSVNFGDGFLISGTRNVFAAKLNPSATQTLWSIGFDDGQVGETLVSAGSVSDSSGNTYITGYFHLQTNFGGFSLTPVSGADMFLVKVDPTGTVLWAKKYGTFGNQYPRSIARNSNDEIIVGGKFTGTADFGGGMILSNGADDVFLAKFDTSGNHRWSAGFGGPGYDDLLDLSAENGEIAITGSYKAAGTNFGGPTLPYQAGEDLMVAKYRDNGSSVSHLFSRGFGTSALERGSAVAIDPVSGDVVASGTFAGSLNLGGPTTYPATGGGLDIFLVQLDASGNWLGDQGFGDSLSSSIISRDVLIDGQGDVFVTGDVSIPVDFGGGLLPGTSQDVFVAEFSSGLSEHLWSERYGALGGDLGTSMTLNSANELLLTGYFWTSVNFGGTTLTSQGIDAFVAALTTD